MALITVSIEPCAVLNDDRQLDIMGMQTLEKLQTVHFRHDQVEHNQLGAIAGGTGEKFETGCATFDSFRFAAKSLDHFLKDFDVAWDRLRR